VIRAVRHCLRNHGTGAFGRPIQAVGIGLLAVICLSGCRQSSSPQLSHDASAVTIDLDSRRPALKLSEYGLFQDISMQTPVAGVVPYRLNATSFMDGGESEFLAYIPPAESAKFQLAAPFDFPIGTILIQHIRFPFDARDPAAGTRLVETRLFIHKNFGWSGTPYLWNEDQSDAERAVIGGKTDITLINRQGEKLTFPYHTPNMNECKRCHVRDEQMVPIGVTARNLNRKIKTAAGPQNQLAFWRQQGMLSGLPTDLATLPALPDWRDETAAAVDRRARAWLDANCAHCHSPGGPAIVSGLDLSFDQTEPVRFGVYKPPVAAGRGSSGHRFSILPRNPEKSFLLHRVRSTELGVMMPPLGRSTADSQGAELMSRWIAEMPEDKALAEAALNPMSAYEDAVDGGDPQRGRVVFFETQKCINCHHIGQQGGDVGPDLSDVGARTKPEYLLESIVDPNAKIAEGFKTEVVMTASGQIVTGVVQSEDQYELVVADANNTHKIEKDEIEERRTSEVSTMPSMANVLTVDQVRDLLAYLRTLRTPPSN